MLGCEPESYTEVRLLVPRRHCDPIANYITENIVPGLLLDDERTDERTAITFYVPDSNDSTFETRLNQYLRTIIEPPDKIPQLEKKTVHDTEWVDMYKKSIRPVLIGDDIVVRPHWTSPLNGVTYDILLDPGMAFGTGSHETTRNCLTAIRRHFQSGWRLLDFGCGSGLLSILADKMGASYIKALDYDKAAIENCHKNFQVNKVRANHDIVFGSLDRCTNDKPYEMVCANVIKSTILSMLPQLVQLTAKDGYMVLSGLLDRDESELNSALNAFHLKAQTVVVENEWLTYTVRH